MSVIFFTVVFVLGIIHKTESNEDITFNDLLLDSLLIQWIPSNYVPSPQVLSVKNPSQQQLLISLEERQMALDNYFRHLLRSIEENNEDTDDQSFPNIPGHSVNSGLLTVNPESIDKSNALANNQPSNCVPIAYDCMYPLTSEKETNSNSNQLLDLTSFYPEIDQSKDNAPDTEDDKDELLYDDMVKGILSLLMLSLTDQSENDDSVTSSCNTNCEALNPEQSSNEQTSSMLQVLLSPKNSDGPSSKTDDDYATYLNCLAEKVSCLYKEKKSKTPGLSKPCDNQRGVKDSNDSSSEDEETDSVESRIFEKWYYPSITQDLLQNVYDRQLASKYADNNKYVGYRKSLAIKKGKNNRRDHKGRARYLSNRTLHRPIRNRVGKRMAVNERNQVKKR